MDSVNGAFSALQKTIYLTIRPTLCFLRYLPGYHFNFAFGFFNVRLLTQGSKSAIEGHYKCMAVLSLRLNKLTNLRALREAKTKWHERVSYW